VILFPREGVGSESCGARDERSGSLFSYVDLEARVGRNHPLRTIRMIVNEALAALAGDFSTLYSPMGRPSIPPEKLPGNAAANLLFNPSFDGAAGVRPSFPWFVGIGVDDSAWDHSVSSKNRDRLLG
jgi:hypothetical protein